MVRHETESLWAFAAEELGAEEQARVAEHVAGCQTCARKLEEVRQAQALLRTVQEDAPEVRWAEVDERVQSAAARKLARLERQPRWPWALATVGALAAVLAFVVLRPVTSTPLPSAPVAVREEHPTPIKEVAPIKEAAPSPTPVIATRAENVSGARIREADAQERALVAGELLRQGSWVRTPAKANALLRLPDASRARLAPGSEVRLTRVEPERVSLFVQRGQLAVQASHATREDFVVEAEGGVRTWVVGTVFSVESASESAVVTVLEGKVRVEIPGQPQQFVSAGERLEVNTARRTLKRRALSAKERQAFQELGVPSQEAAATPRPTPEKTPSEGALSDNRPAPMATAPSGSSEAPDSEPAPSSAPASPEPEEPGVQWVPPEPGTPTQSTADARFLWHAREQLHAKTCESFLVGLEEIAERSKVRDFREQARYLRARCFEERLSPSEAQAEYQRYLREFPKGRYVREAKAALLP
ncbi:FecR domain-containing protein [Hyalangium minutum]|uniref:FecR protein domain-containing protein n=1 Tax=Hyalangium minutum TaxID=394096 RepID=A0A085VYY9_9BACT|nr:FecR domain-containing protein [Hyalangium minutum]KFE60652.1 hypothetical protein DB31_4834 [Hyalangium minutum]